MKTILAAVDLSPLSSHVLKEAVTWAEALSAKLIILHVVPPVSSAIPVGASMEMVSMPLPLSVEEIKEIKARFDDLVASVKTAGVSIQTIIKEAFPADEIKKEVLAHHAKLLIVGSHGHGGLYHLFNGSVVTSLLKQATTPILVVPVKGK